MECLLLCEAMNKRLKNIGLSFVSVATLSLRGHQFITYELSGGSQTNTICIKYRISVDKLNVNEIIWGWKLRPQVNCLVNLLYNSLQNKQLKLHFTRFVILYFNDCCVTILRIKINNPIV